jgi:hypothetical protein
MSQSHPCSLVELEPETEEAPAQQARRSDGAHDRDVVVVVVHCCSRAAGRWTREL